MMMIARAAANGMARRPARNDFDPTVIASSIPGAFEKGAVEPSRLTTLLWAIEGPLSKGANSLDQLPPVCKAKSSSSVAAGSFVRPP